MTNNTRFRYSRFSCHLAVATALALAVVTHAMADDIDVYSSPSAETGIPNVLFIIDNSARWGSQLPGTTSGLLCPDAKGDGTPGQLPPDEVGTKMGGEKCALYTLFYNMKDEDLSSFNFGFMLFNESKYANSSGYPRLSFSWANPLDPSYATTRRAEILKMIAGLRRTSDAADVPTTAETFYEAYLWFKGLPPWKGQFTNYNNKNDVSAFTSASRSRWRAPEIGCARNHIIYLANQSPGDSGQTSEKFLKSIYPQATRISIPAAFNVSTNVNTNDEANWTDEYASFFNLYLDLNPDLDGQQGIQTHTISVTGAPSDGNYPNYFQWVARQGGGQATVATSPAAILDGLTGMLNSIRAKNSVFSAAALPVSANTQGAYLNQVFIGMFRPDGNALPRWVGNLKQYQFKYDSTLDTLELADALGKSAVIADTGFIGPNAESFWTKDSTFWTGDPTKYPNPSDRPDGEVVEKGGVGQWLRTAYSGSTARASRPVYTCLGSSCNGADLANKPEFAFKPANTLLTNSVFGGADKTLLINWLLGDENVLSTNVTNFTAARDQLTTPPSGSTVRPSIHGDVLHSRPIALNYAGASQTPRVYVFYGANDGMLRAINGNQTGSGAGSELWAFVAEEHFPTLNRLRENTPEVKYPSTPTNNTTAQPRSYFFDGPIGAYQNPGAGEVSIFATMRRGGRAVYAFDVKDPLKPRVMWRINENLSDYASMGQTWSTPRPALVKGYSDPVLIMGGGYDNSEDKSDPGKLGRGVYVIDMKTGARLAHLFAAGDPGFSVPSDVSLIDTDRDGYVDRGYFVDVRANVYRIDMEYDAGSPSVGQKREPKDWKVTKIASLADDKDTRRVFFAPDVVLTKNYTALMIGTGDREKPLLDSTNDRFFIIKDSKVTKGEPTPAPTVIKETDLVAVGTDGDKGCFLEFSEASLGEKVINQPITFAGITYFSTNRPVLRKENVKACSATRSRAYQVPLICKSPPEPIALAGDGLPPSPVVGYVEVGNGKVVPFVIGGANTKKSAIEVTRPQISIPGNRKRTYWFMQNQDR